MLRFSVALTIALVTTSFFPAVTFAQKNEKNNAKDELKLEDLFPEKSLFGPSARRPEFSADGRYAAYLYRPYNERRHGNDLWVYDFETRKTKRITDIGMMSEFQRSSRIVIEDRLKKHKPDSEQDDEKSDKPPRSDDEEDETKHDEEEDEEEDAEEEEAEKTEEELQAEREIYLHVSDKDADDEYAPVYSGIASFQWHPTENRLLLISEGDVYLIEDLESPEPVRLTKTDERESQVAFLPDGSGYTVRRDNAVLRFTFGEHLVEQLSPKLPSGENLSRYEISPDGKRMVLVSRTKDSSAGRTVDIIRYRDRFAKSDRVSRTVSDDEVKPQTIKVYLFEFDVAETEQADLIQIF
ncbi:MAG: hypothetical protein ACF787_12150 [Rhodopirellula sp. JB053]